MQIKDKKIKLFNEGFNLFKLKGVEATSIQEIVDKAGVAKGTFYLYFKDKYDLKEQLIIKKSNELFNSALEELNNNTNITKFEDQLIFVLDYVINSLSKNKSLLKFISKNLSSGLYNNKIPELVKNDSITMKELFTKGINENKIKLKNPDMTLYMIIELVSSTVPSVIINNSPTTIEEFKPYLYETIKKMISN